MQITPEFIRRCVCNKYHNPQDGYYIGRGSIWGNPFVMSGPQDRAVVVTQYAHHLMSQPRLIDRARDTLGDKTLMCYCSPLLCHGHVLAFVTHCDLRTLCRLRSNLALFKSHLLIHDVEDIFHLTEV